MILSLFKAKIKKYVIYGVETSFLSSIDFFAKFLFFYFFRFFLMEQKTAKSCVFINPANITQLLLTPSMSYFYKY